MSPRKTAAPLGRLAQALYDELRTRGDAAVMGGKHWVYDTACSRALALEDASRGVVLSLAERELAARVTPRQRAQYEAAMKLTRAAERRERAARTK